MAKELNIQHPNQKYGSSINNYALVGIEGYTTPEVPPMSGAIKANIADFIVREISLSGEVLSTYEKERKYFRYSKKDRFTIFTLIKKNMDTIIAAKTIQKFLNVRSNAIQWAGIKDHTAITAQQMSVYGNYMEKLRHFSHPNITISDIRSHRKGLDLGRLWGNNFAINIRKMDIPFEDLHTTLQQWEDQINTFGVPNFFGMQRFGQHRPNSHVIGKKLFQLEYKQAVEEFLLTTYPLEYDQIASFRRNLAQTKDYEQGLKDCPRSLFYEKLMIESLANHPGDYQRAIKALPLPLQNLIHSSFQSYIFNRAVSIRLKQSENLIQPLKGDVVAILNDPRGHPSLVHYIYQGGSGWNDATILKAIKHERAAILAPILGYKTDLSQFPAFEPIYHKILEEEQFQSFQFKLHDPSLFRFEGTFRTITIRPSNLRISQATIINKHPETDPTGVRMEFSLPKGTYATLVLREFRK